MGDDSVALAALSAVGTLLAPRRGRPVWLVATVGEEGLGNLRGIVGALEGFVAPIDAVLAVEGNYLGRVSTVGDRIASVARASHGSGRPRLGGRRMRRAPSTRPRT